MATQTIIPQRVAIPTSLDLIAELIGLKRLPGENLKDFKLRILDAYIHKANASYDGLYNSIARELGEEAYSGGLVIDVDRVDDIPLDDESDIVINNKNIVFTTSSGTTSYNLHSRTGGVFFIQDLVSTINNSSLGFTISTWGTVGNYDKSSFLKKVISKRNIYNRQLQPSTLHTMYDVMDTGSWFTDDVSFSSSTKIKSLASSLASLDEDQYFVAKYDRSIYTFDYPIGSVNFSFQSFPLVVPISTISIREFRDDLFIDLITEQPLDEFENELDGIPTVEGADYINELLSVTPMYYGE